MAMNLDYLKSCLLVLLQYGFIPKRRIKEQKAKEKGGRGKRS